MKTNYPYSVFVQNREDALDVNRYCTCMGYKFDVIGSGEHIIAVLLDGRHNYSFYFYIDDEKKEYNITYEPKSGYAVTYRKFKAATLKNK